MANLQLEYAALSNPNPVRCSVAGASSQIDLELVISNPGVSPVTLAKIEVNIPVGGTGGGDLSSASNLPGPQPTQIAGWTASTSGSVLTLAPTTGTSASVNGALVITLPAITVDETPGEVTIDAAEAPAGGGPVAGQPATAIEKWSADLVVTDFKATPTVLTEIDKTVVLTWTVTDAEHAKPTYTYALRTDSWTPKDCLGAGDCYTWQDGAAGITSPPLRDSTTFYLDVIETTDSGGRKVAYTFATTVAIDVPTISPSSYCLPSPTGRLASLHWAAWNADHCVVLLDGDTIDAEAPLDTYLTGYPVVLSPDPPHQLAVTAVPAPGGPPGPSLPFPDVGSGSPASIAGVGWGQTVAVTPDSQLAAIASLDGLYVVDLAAQTVEPAIDTLDSVWTVELTPDGTRGLVLTQGLQLGLFDVRARALSFAGLSFCAGLAIAASGTFAGVTLSAQRMLAIVDVSTGAVQGAPIPLGAPGPSTEQVAPLALTPDGTLAVVVDKAGGAVVFVDIHARNVASVAVGAQPTDVVITPDGTLALVVNSADNTVSVIDIASRNVEAATIPTGSSPNALCLSPDGRFAFVCNEGSNDVTVIDITGRAAQSTTIAIGGDPRGCAFIPSGAGLAVVDPPGGRLVIA
jgi:YVTN family beta-propeller protein